jgi:caffeoyl-CoA O-methyltransferase
VDIVNPQVETYMSSLQEGHDDDPVLLEMEEYGREQGFPIVGRLVGVILEVLARAVGARRVFELGSGYGYSAYWFARAVGPGGEVHLTDANPENEPRAVDYLARAGVGAPIRFHVGDAVTSLERAEGEFDVVFTDIDKIDYPAAWSAAGDRIRPGGLYLCDNAIQAGPMSVIDVEGSPRPDWARAVQEHNQAVARDERFLTTLLPVRDGVLVALRLSEQTQAGRTSPLPPST